MSIIVTLQEMRNRQAIGEKLQTNFNTIVNVEHDYAMAFQFARCAALASHAKSVLPDHWDDAQLVLMKIRLEDHNGVILEPGDYALTQPLPPQLNDGVSCHLDGIGNNYSVFSVRRLFSVVTHKNSFQTL